MFADVAAAVLLHSLGERSCNVIFQRQNREIEVKLREKKNV